MAELKIDFSILARLFWASVAAKRGKKEYRDLKVTNEI